ncbi:MAG: hypothetical protein QOF77_199 [Solirubrobacteraceae bacterium]|nr:hypothetical protein [Solirubrobacteraceae bacterium]
MISRPRARSLLRPGLPILLAVLLAGCGSSSSSGSKTAGSTSSTSTPAPAPAPASGAVPAASGKVGIANYKFAPPAFAVKRGGSVTFTNRDPTPHTATADTGPSFDTGTLQQGQSKAVTFSTAGTFKYHCVFHAFMTGSITVS